MPLSWDLTFVPKIVKAASTHSFQFSISKTFMLLMGWRRKQSSHSPVDIRYSKSNSFSHNSRFYLESIKTKANRLHFRCLLSFFLSWKTGEKIFSDLSSISLPSHHHTISISGSTRRKLKHKRAGMSSENGQKKYNWEWFIDRSDLITFRSEQRCRECRKNLLPTRFSILCRVARCFVISFFYVLYIFFINLFWHAHAHTRYIRCSIQWLVIWGK